MMVEHTKLSMRNRVAIGLGSATEGMRDESFATFLLFYYTQVLGLPGTLAGGAMFVALCVDALTDPLIGSFSDNLKSRFGRRHPFMVIAIIPVPIALCFVFAPPDFSNNLLLFLWLGAFTSFVRVSISVFSVPNVSLIAEATTDLAERTVLAGFRVFFIRTAAIATGLIGFLHFFSSQEGGVDGRLNAGAYEHFGVFCACLAFFSMVGCVGGTANLIPRLKSASLKGSRHRASFIGDVRNVWKNRPFRMLLIASACCYTALGALQALSLYINTYFWEFEPEQIAKIVVGILLGLVVAISSARPITERIGKRKAAMACITLLIPIAPMPILLRFVGALPPNGHEALLPIIAGFVCVQFILMSIITIVATSMFADEVDAGELQTGHRQEGLYMAAASFMEKMTIGGGTLVAGVLIEIINFPPGANPGEVSAVVVRNLGIVTGPGIVWLLLPALYFLSRHRETSGSFSNERKA